MQIRSTSPCIYNNLSVGLALLLNNYRLYHGNYEQNCVNNSYIRYKKNLGHNFRSRLKPH